MPNRTMCQVLSEMRKCYETRNFCGILGLIEEVQSMGNRMEAALWDQDEVKHMKKELKQKLKELEDE